MAVLNTEFLQEVRHAVERENLPITYTRGQINGVSQAVEDTWVLTCAPAISTAIELAMPGLPNAVKLAIAKHVILEKLTRNI